MAAPLDCPDVDCWQALFEDTLSPEQRQRWERHLEACPRCQERLEQPGEFGDLLRTCARRVGDPTLVPGDPNLVGVVERLRREGESLDRPPSAEPADLYFLEPTVRPGLLGTLGSYEVEEVIGQGGMGVVLKAFEPALHRHVAIKILAPALAASAAARRRFTREAQAAAAVSHDHIVTVHAVHQGEGLPYLVMQYVPGESVQDRLNRTGPLEPEEVVRIGMQAASGLAAAHAQGLIHRDIKPANLLLENGLAKVKITDFGLARLVSDVGLTQCGVVAGTPEYMAPEQARGEEIDHRADLYALGAVLYACCTGVPPFHGPAPLAVLRRVADEAPTPMRSVNPEVPAWLEVLVARLLAKDPAQRVQTAAEVATLLEGYLAHLRRPTGVPAPGLGALRPDPGPAGGSRTGAVKRLPHLLWLAAVVLLGVPGLGIGWWLAAGAAETAPPAKPAQEYFRSFRGDADIGEEFRFDGLEPQECVHCEPTGLRVTLPAGHPGKRMGTGLASNFSVKGDFQITLGYEILKEPEPADAGQGTGVYLWVDLEAPAIDRAMLFRETRGDRRFAVGYYVSPRDVDKPAGQQPKWEGCPPLPTAAPAGRLRLVRTGPLLSCYVAENGSEEFTLLHQHPFGTEDVRYVRIGGVTGGPNASLDARFTDLRVVGEALPGAPAVPVGPPQKAEATHWLAGVFALGLLGTVALALAVWFGTRRRGRPATVASVPNPGAPATTAAPVAFACASCGKGLKARADLAGKKVKCRHCNQVVLVPPAPSGESTANAS
jgi:serine/threonine protein kinase